MIIISKVVLLFQRTKQTVVVFATVKCRAGQPCTKDLLEFGKNIAKSILQQTTAPSFIFKFPDYPGILHQGCLGIKKYVF